MPREVTAKVPVGIPGSGKSLWICAGILTLLFAIPIWDWMRFSLKSDLASHTLLIPVVSAYLIWLKRKNAYSPVKPAPILATALATLGCALLLFYIWRTNAHPGTLAENDRVALLLAAYLSLGLGSVFFFFGNWCKTPFAFPLAFLVFMLPMPSLLVNILEVFFQYTSAEAANLMLKLSGVPMIRDGLVFRIPGIAIKVAEECSGIRSSYVLFITSVLAGHLFLQTTWRKIFLACFVIPLGIIRNGFRIFTIAMLCVHISPDMIDSRIHHRGGPIFFVLSLLPFFVLLLWLRKSERKAGHPTTR